MTNYWAAYHVHSNPAYRGLIKSMVDAQMAEEVGKIKERLASGKAWLDTRDGR